MAYNKIHPTTLKVHSPYSDFKTLEIECREMEKKYNLKVDLGREDKLEPSCKPIPAQDRGGRTIPLNKELMKELAKLTLIAETKRLERGFLFVLSAKVITSERGERMSKNYIAHWFKRLYGNLGFDGCSS